MRAFCDPSDTEGYMMHGGILKQILYAEGMPEAWEMLRENARVTMEGAILECAGGVVCATGRLSKGAKGGEDAGKRFTKSVKLQAKEATKGKCTYCDVKTTATPGPKQGQTDHVYPRSAGGTNAAENAAHACRTCNQMKGAKTLKEFLKYLRESLKAGDG
jgi:hypothetical protein